MRFWLLLLSVLPALGATVEAPAGGYAYPCVTAAWAAPLPRAISELSPEQLAALPALGELSKLDLKDPSQRQAWAPVVFALSHDLGLTPAKLMAISSPADRASALHMAFEEAQAGLEAKVRELSARARDSAWSVPAGDREAQAKLYRTIAQLREVRAYYQPLLSETSRAEAARADELASARAVAIRDELVRRAGAAAADGTKAPAVSESERAAVLALPAPGVKAEKLLERMEATKSGWGVDDFRALYNGYGFIERQGGKHVIFTHPLYKDLWTTVSHSGGTLAPGYAVDAVKLIRKLEQRKAAARDEPGAPATGPPQALALSDFDFLLARPASGLEVPGRSAKRRAARDEARRAREPAPVKPAPAKAGPGPAKTPVAVAEKPVMTLQPAQPREEKAAAPVPQPEPAPAAAPPERKGSVYDVIWAYLRAKLGGSKPRS